jgi:hypothetical protein
MKKLLILALAISIFGCTNSPQDIIDQTIDYLSTEKAIKYDLKKLIIQGNGSDTLLISQATTAYFNSVEGRDNLIGFNFIFEDSLVHPYFNFPMKNTYTYDGKLLKYESINPMHNETKISNKSEIDISILNSYISGHLPILLKLLNGDSYVNRLVSDTLLDDSKHILIKQADTTGIVYELFIKIEDTTPSFLRITTNPTQPFVEEFNYANFEQVDTTIVVQEKFKPNTQDRKSM